MQYSVVNYKTVKENSDFRIDADYFKPEFLNSLELVTSRENSMLSEISNVNGGKRLPLGENFSDEGIPYIRAEDVKNGFVEYQNSPKISLKLHDLLKKYQTKKDDVLITIVGNIGDVGIVKFDLKKCNLTENCAKITNLEKVIPEFLFAFLLSKHGQIQIHREKVGTVQPKLALERIRKFKIPVFSVNFQSRFSYIINQANQLIDQSKSLYSKAEQLLLSELGLLDWKPRHQLAFVKNYSATVEAERIDAEYFQPKYEEIIKAVKNYKGGFDTLGKLVKIKKSVEPGSEAYQEKGVPFVRVSNLSKFGIFTNNQQFISDELYEELKIHQPKKGEILLSKDATPGIAYFLNEEPQKMIVSGGILRLKMDSRQILPEYLTLVLNSVIVQKQIERDAGGSIINHWRPDQVKATLIPILKEDKQKEIKELIEKSFNERKLSKSLLEIAKRGVEMAIEKDEQEAEKWMNNELEKLNIKL
jgi:restriction endonuclease S subunit